VSEVLTFSESAVWQLPHSTCKNNIRINQKAMCHEILGSRPWLWTSVADPDPGSGAFLPPVSGIRIRDEFFPDPGSRIQGVCFYPPDPG
jgi:hypothetical protein